MIYFWISIYLFIGYMTVLIIYAKYKDARDLIKEETLAAGMAALLWPLVILAGLLIYPFSVIDKKGARQ